MKLNNKILISWILVILWMITIFYLSSMNSEVSNTKSKDTINTVVTTTIETTNKDISQDKVNSIVNILNKPLRKCMHSIVFFILVVLLINAFYNTNIRNYKAYVFSIIISFIYACTDEYHQLFVLGRTGQFTDVLIDTIGVLLGCLVFYGVYRVINKNRKNKINV